MVNIRSKIQPIPNNASNGAIATKTINLVLKECPPDDNDVAALEPGHASAIKLKNTKAAPHSVVASAREHKDDDDDDADGGAAGGSGANGRAATKLDRQVATMTPWISSSAFKSMLLELITRGLHESEVNPIYSH